MRSTSATLPSSAVPRGPVPDEVISEKTEELTREHVKNLSKDDRHMSIQLFIEEASVVRVEDVAARKLLEEKWRFVVQDDQSFEVPDEILRTLQVIVEARPLEELPLPAAFSNEMIGPVQPPPDLEFKATKLWTKISRTELAAFHSYMPRWVDNQDHKRKKLHLQMQDYYTKWITLRHHVAALARQTDTHRMQTTIRNQRDHARRQDDRIKLLEAELLLRGRLADVLFARVKDTDDCARTREAGLLNELQQHRHAEATQLKKEEKSLEKAQEVLQGGSDDLSTLVEDVVTLRQARTRLNLQQQPPNVDDYPPSPLSKADLVRLTEQVKSKLEGVAVEKLQDMAFRAGYAKRDAELVNFRASLRHPEEEKTSGQYAFTQNDLRLAIELKRKEIRDDLTTQNHRRKWLDAEAQFAVSTHIAMVATANDDEFPKSNYKIVTDHGRFTENQPSKLADRVANFVFGRGLHREPTSRWYQVERMTPDWSLFSFRAHPRNIQEREGGYFHRLGVRCELLRLGTSWVAIGFEQNMWDDDGDRANGRWMDDPGFVAEDDEE
ncbi:uncharacterized protein J4E79_008601 [Alternaria viburni]|uniref:uncharacterized protein n=1 Tax=Alternaria viburni TaxID=566460 RepID=UPI0020C4B6DF|nr:uncharacterized protein J4E79_008601 [Alternaria viburni]KAI4653088.1 hypothetical protein J4E79_008601 [Alternaria viburni]